MEVYAVRTYKSFDWFLFVIISLLIIIGILMVYSASSVWAIHRFNDGFYFAKRQLLFASFGFILMYILSFIPYHVYKSLARPLFLVSLLLVIAVVIPGVGLVRGGARSWIGVGAFSIQPAEFIKLSLIMYLARLITKRKIQLDHFFKSFLPLVLLIVICFGLIMLQPDLGTGMVLVMSSLILLFIAGAKVSYFVGLITLGVIGLILLILSAPYRINRITAFLNPWEDPLGSGFQIIQSLYAIGPGGLFGVGFNQSLQKYFYLPEPHNDFIFSIVSEEFGFIGAAFIICLFVLLIYRLVRIAFFATDPFASLVVSGITAMIAIQVMINISVVIGLIPVTGITLPFLSYGGSSLTLLLASMGIVLNISRA
ncbi:spore cortex peptidoglycan biosynthesis regulator SpoVE [Pelagirhabdus alkalitolerans]|uniref:Spore cortex peptidoglycan biosynthesis regulator SpoVE n=1 Tax=Pelagirhabdus alkalitolerans TaxID=1612202 RepID=A0A1G6H0A1_9BACI|nr:stage V sporulation protein E [Pelagirhabdus alkalitolerans]SDB87583.1 spore cortex peptidoglycan biosynthesis regulator SpoVE [Pelagirhabdus alkalitolerans]